uniref:G_PROTEIN_RECEP_F1_2 domain-containing protein n=1 Tax=Meloidogyne hapla TaxID=6305 RepID=A0A1I8BQJ1_MELHA
MPAYIYVSGSPLLHFAIMIERVLATVYVKIYEKHGILFGVISTIILWVTLAIFVIFMCLTNMGTDTYSHPMVYFTVTSIYNDQFAIITRYFFLFLALCISFVDYLLIRLNQKIKLNL